MTDSNRGTQRRSLRVPEPRWQRFKALCKRQGTDASAKLNAYMQTEIDNDTQEGKTA